MVNAAVYKALSLDKRQATAFLALVSEHSQNLSAQWERLEDVARQDLTDHCVAGTPTSMASMRHLVSAQEIVNEYERSYKGILPPSAPRALCASPGPVTSPTAANGTANCRDGSCRESLAQCALDGTVPARRWQHRTAKERVDWGAAARGLCLEWKLGVTHW